MKTIGFLVSCAVLGSTAIASEFTVRKDVEFLEPGRAQKLDAYLPSDAFQRPHPAVLLIHGGGWVGGSKGDAREKNVASTLAENGYAVFVIDYLLNGSEKDPKTGKLRSTTVAWPRNFLDCKTGLRFIRKEAVRFGVDPKRVAVMGESAGATFAMLLGFTANDDGLNRGGLYNGESNAVSCIVEFYGANDMSDKGHLHKFAGATDEESRENARVASPRTYLRPGLQPMLTVHGDADKTVSVEFSREIVRRYRELGNAIEYVEIPGAPHSFHLQPEQMDLRPVVLGFLKKHLGEPAHTP